MKTFDQTMRSMVLPTIPNGKPPKRKRFGAAIKVDGQPELDKIGQPYTEFTQANFPLKGMVLVTCDPRAISNSVFAEGLLEFGSP
jgi:hypothetical protein